MDSLEKIEADLHCALIKLHGATAVGIDFEFGGSDEDKFIALVQIALPGFAMLLRTRRKEDAEPFTRDGPGWQSGLPIWVRNLIINPGVQKATVDFAGEDRKYLQSCFDIVVTDPIENHGIFELQDKVQPEDASIRAIANHFGFFPYKNRHLVGVKVAWDALQRLPEAKIRYAIEDAWFALLMYEYIKQSASSDPPGLAAPPVVDLRFLENLHPPKAYNPMPIGSSKAADNKERARVNIEYMQMLKSSEVKSKQIQPCRELMSIYRPFVTASATLKDIDISTKGSPKCIFEICAKNGICAEFFLPLKPWSNGVRDSVARVRHFHELTAQVMRELCLGDAECERLAQSKTFDSIRQYISQDLPKGLTLQIPGNQLVLFCAAKDCVTWYKMDDLTEIVLAIRKPHIDVLNQKTRMFDQICREFEDQGKENAGEVRPPAKERQGVCGGK